jgi:hypothetical protein
MFCPFCGLRQSDQHRFCFSCGAPLPRQLLRTHGPKLSEWFRAIPVVPQDPKDAALRVSRYLEEIEIESGGRSVRVPSHHVRFSIWVLDRVLAAISLPDDEAVKVSQFLQTSVEPLPPHPTGEAKARKRTPLKNGG